MVSFSVESCFSSGDAGIESFDTIEGMGGTTSSPEQEVTNMMVKNAVSMIYRFFMF